MYILLSILIALYAVLVVRNKSISGDTILASMLALVGFNVLLALYGLTVGAVAFLGACMVVIWAFEVLRRPRVGMWRLPGGVVIGLGVMRQYTPAY